MKTIPLTNGGFAKVDDDFSDSDWTEWFCGTDGYARNTEGKLLHRQIMDAPKGVMVDHINHDKLDNQRCNLRLCTNQENQMNRVAKKGKKHSKYKGITKNGNRWQAHIQIDGKRAYLGLFDTELAAALAYNEKAKKHFGDFANLNQVSNG